MGSVMNDFEHRSNNSLRNDKLVNETRAFMFGCECGCVVKQLVLKKAV